MGGERLLLRDDPLTSLADGDRFRHTAYEQALERIVDDVEPPFTIGLYGQWGTGKSTIAKQLEPHYRHEGGRRTAYVYLDVWRFQLDSFRRQVLLDIEKALDSQGVGSSGKVRKRLDEEHAVPVTGELRWDAPRLRWLVAILGGGLIAAGALYFLLKGVGADNPEFSLVMLVVVPLLLQATTRVPDVLVREEVTVTTLPPVSADQFEACFRELIVGELGKRKVAKVVTVVDNLDRLQSSQVVEVLGSIKTFLELPDSPFVFVVPCDHEAIQRHVSSQFRGRGPGKVDEHASEFLRKFFNVTIPLSTFYEDEMRAFAREELGKIELGSTLLHAEQSARLAQMIALAFSSSPRRVKQFLNNVAARMLVARARIDEGILNLGERPFDPLLLAKLMVIEERWPNEFRRIQERPDVLLGLQGSARNEDARRESEEADDAAGLQQFLLATEEIVARSGSIRAYLLLKQTEDEASLLDYQQFRAAVEAGDPEAIEEVLESEPALEGPWRRVLLNMVGELADRGEAGQTRNALGVLLALASKYDSVEKIALADDLGRLANQHSALRGVFPFVTIGPLLDLLAASPRQRARLDEALDGVIEALTYDDPRKSDEAIVGGLSKRVELLSEAQKERMRVVLVEHFSENVELLLAVARDEKARSALVSPDLVEKFVSGLSSERLRGG